MLAGFLTGNPAMVYQRIQEEVKAHRGLTIDRMVELGPGFPVRALSLRRERAEVGPGYGSARCDSEDRRGVAQLRPAADYPPSCAARQGWHVNPETRSTD